MRTLMMLVLATATGSHGPANSQQVPAKVFQLVNQTNARLDFHVLTSATKPLTAQNAAILASGGQNTFSCGLAKCYVVMSPRGKVRGRWGVNQGSKYKFTMVNGALSLNLTS